MQYIAGPDGQKMYTKESTHLPTLNALLADASLYDAQHKRSSTSCRRPRAGRRSPSAPPTGTR